MSFVQSSQCIVYLIRHGATQHNDANPPLLQGRGIDLGLSETGRQQARKTAAFLSHYSLDAVYASPLKRAVETADFVARAHQLAVQIIPEFIEADVGAWEGRSWDEISKTEPDRHAQFLADPAMHGYRDGENLTQVLERTMPAFEHVIGNNAGRRIAVVGHNVVNRVILARLIGAPLPRYRNVNQDNGGINVLRYRDGQLKVITVNSVFHLE
jgi:broad specificity phosphatase PhoE